MQNRVKIDLKLCPGGAWGVPRGLSGASRGTVRAHFETQLKINENFQGFWEAPGTSREPPGDPEGPQKSTPKRFFAKKGRSKREFSSLFARKAVVQPFCTFFFSFFHEKSMKNQWKKRYMFSQRRSFFWTWRPSRNTVFYDMKATSPFLVFLRFVSKKHQKNGSKIQATILPPKSTKKWSRGSELGTKMVLN